jgi:hypothetical protein
MFALDPGRDRRSNEALRSIPVVQNGLLQPDLGRIAVPAAIETT